MSVFPKQSKLRMTADPAQPLSFHLAWSDMVPEAIHKVHFLEVLYRNNPGASRLPLGIVQLIYSMSTPQPPFFSRWLFFAESDPAIIPSLPGVPLSPRSLTIPPPGNGGDDMFK